MQPYAACAWQDFAARLLHRCSEFVKSLDQYAQVRAKLDFKTALHGMLTPTCFITNARRPPRHYIARLLLFVALLSTKQLQHTPWQCGMPAAPTPGCWGFSKLL